MLTDRVNIISIATLATASITAYTYPDSNEHLLVAYLTGLISMSAITLTGCGTNAKKVYKEVMREIKHRGTLKERYVKSLIKLTENEEFLGYCQQQGCYLAAKHTGNAKTFRKVAKEYSNVVIPFF